MHVFASGRWGGEEGELIRGFGLGLSNPVGKGGVPGGVGGEWEECLSQGLERWGGVMSVLVML